MKEIYLLNKGDTVEKAKKELGFSDDYKISNETIWGYNYIEVSRGSDEVLLVKNYLPSFMYKVKKNENIMDILSRGFSVGEVKSVFVGDILILNRPKSIRYIVAPLESLDNIAEKFGVEKEVIISTNNLKTHKLFVGQILWI